MDRRLVFDLLEYPITPALDTSLVVYGGKTALRHVPLRGSEFAVRDVASVQSDVPWLVTDREWYLLVENRKHELAFDISRFGRPVGGGGVDFYPALVDCAVSEASSVFVLNSTVGAWVFVLRGRELRVLNASPIPFIACSSWGREDKCHFSGLTSRPRAARAGTDEVEVAPGDPTILSISPAVERDRDPIVEFTRLADVVRLERWVDALPRDAKQSPRLAGQLVPETCVAASRLRRPQVLLVGILAKPDWYDPMDALGIYPMNTETFGVLYVSPEDVDLLDLRLQRNVLGVLRMKDATQVYVGANRGGGAPIGSIARVDLDAESVGREEQVTVDGIDAGALCLSFQPRFHLNVGYFGTARISFAGEKSAAHFLQSDDGLVWRVVGRAGSVPPAPV